VATKRNPDSQSQFLVAQKAPEAAISPIGFANINKQGIIRSPNHAYGTYGRSVILNTGTMEGGANEAIISNFDADDVATNSGTLIGGNGVVVHFGGSDDLFNLQNGSRLIGVADGGTGTDTLNLENGMDFDVGGVVNFERLGTTSGVATACGEGQSESTSVSSGTTCSGAMETRLPPARVPLDLPNARDMILADRQAVEAIVKHLIKPESMPLLQVRSFSETQRTSASAELQRRQRTLLDNM